MGNPIPLVHSPVTFSLTTNQELEYPFGPFFFLKPKKIEVQGLLSMKIRCYIGILLSRLKRPHGRPN